MGPHQVMCHDGCAQSVGIGHLREFQERATDDAGGSFERRAHFSVVAH